MEDGIGTTHADASRQALNTAATPGLAVLFAGVRFLGMLGPSSLRPLLPASFVLMTLAPWLYY